MGLAELLGLGTGALKTASGASGLYRAATGGGDPVGAGINAAGSLAKVAGGINDLSNAAGYGTQVPYVNYVAGPLGLAAGGYQLSEDDLAGIGSLYGGALGTTAAAGQLLGGTAAGATAATAAGTGATTAGMMAGAVNPVTAALGVFLALGLMNRQHQEQERIENQTKESVRMREGAQRGLGRLLGTQVLSGQANELEDMTTEAQSVGLTRLLDAYRMGMDGHHVVQQTIGSKGQGGRASLTDLLPDPVVDRMTEQYYPALRDTQVGFTRAIDAAAQGGADVPDWATQGFGTYDPAALLSSMSTGMYGNQAATVNPYWDVDYSKAVPGTYGTELPRLLSETATPEAAQPILDRFDAMPALGLDGLTPLTDQQISDAASARTTAAEGIRDYNWDAAQYAGGTGLPPWATGEPITEQWSQSNPGAMAFSAPYLEGGTEQLWRDLGIDDEWIEKGRTGMTDLPSALGAMWSKKYAEPTPTG